MTNQKQKGKRVELDIAHWLKEKGFSSARRTQQFNGAAGLSDVVIDELPQWHIECKGTKSPLLNRSTLLKWYEQIKRDCPENQTPVIFNKANGKPIVAITPYIIFANYKYSIPMDEKIVLGDSFYPALELEELVERRKVSIAVGSSVPTNKSPISVLYYMIEDVVLVLMLGEDFIKLIGRA